MIRVNHFRPSIPRRSAKLLEVDQAQRALNCKLTSGSLRPLRVPAEEFNLPHAGALKSIYLFARQFWFAWAADVDVVRGPIPTDTTERTYWTGDGAYPKATDASIATAGGGTSYPNNHWRLGIPAPTNAATAIIDPFFPGDIEPDSAEFQVWVYTYVSGWQEEGPPSPPSASLSRSRDTGGDLLPVDLTMDTAPTGAYNIVAKRIYRLNTGNVGEDYQFVAEVPVAQTAYEDAVQNDALAEVLQTTGWDAPPDTMKGLIILPNGVAAGFDSLDVLFSVPYQLHAWPREYMLTVDEEVVGLGAFGTNVVICTEGQPYIATGVDPAGMALSKLEIEQACVSKRSIARMGLEGVVYASPDGLVLIGPGSASVVTHNLFSRDEWQALSPETMVAFSHDQAYVAFYDTGAVSGCIVMDARVNGIVHVELDADGGYVDLLTDTLYLLVNGKVMEWDPIGGTAMEASWKSKVFPGRPDNPSMAQVIAQSYPAADGVELRIWGDGALRHTQQVAGPEPFRLPGGFLARDWEFQVSGPVEVEEVLIGDVEQML